MDMKSGHVDMKSGHVDMKSGHVDMKKIFRVHLTNLAIAMVSSF